MATSMDVKYPNSANLFSFCKSILDSKFGHLRVIDQDVGQLLNFDPADCSHWKKGRKNVRSVEAIQSIAKHLEVDERLVLDVASGVLSDVEALIEYRGSGPFQVPANLLENIRNDWQRNQGKAWTPELDDKTRAYFSVNSAALQSIVDQIHERINFREAPLFIPEIMNAYPSLRVVTRSDPNGAVKNSIDMIPVGRRMSDGSFEIHCLEGSYLRPVVRFHMVKAMAPFFISDVFEPEHIAFKSHADLMKTIYANIFAARLLVPAKLLRREISTLNLARDMVTQLAENFWVSRGLMNRRLRDILSGVEESLKS